MKLDMCSVRHGPRLPQSLIRYTRRCEKAQAIRLALREFWQEREAERLERLALDLDYESDYIYGFLYWKDDPEEAEQREKEEERLSCYDDCDDDRYMGRYDDPLFEDLY